MIYLPSIVVGLCLLAVIVLILAQGTTALWRWLFAIEVVVLFGCLGNCLVPGSWKSFWETEIPAVLIAGGLACASSILRRHRERDDRENSTWAVLAAPQMLSFYIVFAIVAVIVASH